ncbi:hypothetical protein HK097_010934 [Rhizophlyctis rosea]|uniref:Ubiquitin-like protease family profile domain-containing protein n=1 Tax=Rhizophlyctis rosea TaxID=64517 RepID=A0AAD5S9A6_9FUNG|nr:hypothetical protein HK097_010934 [Rhizophlyctis rosea]
MCHFREPWVSHWKAALVAEQPTKLDQPTRRSSRVAKASPVTNGQDMRTLIENRRDFVYPADGKNSVAVTAEDYLRLQDGEFLNDTVIEFYIKYLLNEKIKNEFPARVEESHFFNSFFYEQLQRKEGGRKDDDAAYQRVQKWTKKMNIFEKKYIFVPINEHLHWYLALIYNPGALLRPVEEEDESEPPEAHVSDPAESDSMDGIETNPASPAADIEIDVALTSPGAETSLREDTINVDDEEDAVPSRSHVDQPDDPMDIDIDDARTVGEEEIRIADSQPTPGESGLPSASLGSSKKPVALEDSIREDMSEGAPLPRRSQPPRSVRQNAKSVVDVDITDEDFAPPPPPKRAKPKALPKPLTPAQQHKENLRVANSLRRCQIIIFDSLGGIHNQAVTRLKSYLIREARNPEKQNAQITDEEAAERIKSKPARPPQQDNWCDCGVFLLHYIEVFLQNPDKYLDLIFRKRTDESAWFAKTDVEQKRRQILELMNARADAYDVIRKEKGKGKAK